MKPVRIVMWSFGLGTLFGVAIIVACNGDNIAESDATVSPCDCPAAEPPLMGRIRHISAAQPVEQGASLCCNADVPGSTALGGSCGLESAELGLHIRETSLSSKCYSCGVGGGPPEGNIVIAVTCLDPPQ